MKRFIGSCITFAVILALIIIHSVSMVRMGNKIRDLSDKTEKCVLMDDWDSAQKYLSEIKDEWDRKSIWTALTIKTDDIEQIEISLSQSEKYAKLKAKEQFIGEFTMFSRLAEHIPHQEGFHIEELL